MAKSKIDSHQLEATFASSNIQNSVPRTTQSRHQKTFYLSTDVSQSGGKAANPPIKAASRNST